jgi:hypothetical protein
MSRPTAPNLYAAPASTGRLPWAALLVMALMGFLLIAGLGTAGQLVSAFTLGTVLATIPLIALTRQTATSEASGENADVANSKLGVSLGR